MSASPESKTPTPTPEPMTGKRARCGMPCLTHPHACDRSPKHTGVHRDVQQKSDHSCEWDTPGPGDVPALLAALKKSRSGARELGQIVVFLTDLMKDAFQRGGSDPIGALHMLGNHLAEALVSDEDADEFNRAYRALGQRRDEVKRLRADLEQCRSMLRESERTAADLKGHVERQRGQDEKLLAALERDEAERNRFRAERDEAVATVEKALADVEAIVKERDRLSAELAAFVPPGALAAGEIPALCGTCKELSCVPGLPGCARCVRAEVERLRAREALVQGQVDVVRRVGEADTARAAYEAMDAERRNAESRRAVDNLAFADRRRERDEARAEVERVRDLHAPVAGLPNTDGPVCRHCVTYDGQTVPAPCPTVRALDGTEADRG